MSYPRLAISKPIFQPAMRIITAITNGINPTVTTSFDHQYKTGLIVRLDIPTGFGMTQANKMFGPITVTSSNQFTLPIDTTNFDPFMIATAFPYSQQYAQCVPFGNANDQLFLGTLNVLNTNFYN